jgi:hypothetical protein
MMASAQRGVNSQPLSEEGLASLCANMDQWLRSPVFLEALKQSLGRMVELKQLQNQFTDAVSEQAGPAAVDFGGLLKRIEIAQQTILQRLAALEERLLAIDGSLRSGDVGQAPKRKKTAAKRSGGHSPGRAAS